MKNLYLPKSDKNIFKIYKPLIKLILSLIMYHKLYGRLTRIKGYLYLFLTKTSCTKKVPNRHRREKYKEKECNGMWYHLEIEEYFIFMSFTDFSYTDILPLFIDNYDSWNSHNILLSIYQIYGFKSCFKYLINSNKQNKIVKPYAEEAKKVHIYGFNHYLHVSLHYFQKNLHLFYRLIFTIE